MPCAQIGGRAHARQSHATAVVQKQPKPMLKMATLRTDILLCAVARGAIIGGAKTLIPLSYQVSKQKVLLCNTFFSICNTFR